MAGPKKNSKTDQIPQKIETMASALKAGAEFDMWAWKSLMRDVESLESNPSFLGPSILNKAVLWSFRDSQVEVQRCLNRYAGLRGKTWDWHMVRATMASMLGDVEPISSMLDFGYPKSNGHNLIQVVDVCCQAGFFVSAWEALRLLKEIDSGFDRQFENVHYHYLEKAAEYLISHKVEELKIAERVVYAGRLLLDNGYRLSKYSITANEYGITFELALKAEIETLVDLNILLSEKFVTDFEESLSEHLSVGVYPFEEDDL